MCVCVNTCVCLRGAACLLCPGRLRPPAERLFPRSHQGRWETGGDLASPQKGFRERPGAGGCPFTTPSPTTRPRGTRTLGRGKRLRPLPAPRAPLGSPSGPGHQVPRAASGWGGGGPGAQAARLPPGCCDWRFFPGGAEALRLERAGIPARVTPVEDPAAGGAQECSPDKQSPEEGPAACAREDEVYQPLL